MEHNRVLIVCDDSPRRKFIEQKLTHHNLKPVSYPNFLSARKAITSDPFAIIVVDLSMPIEQKLALVREACKSQPDAQVITLEKLDYIRDTGALSSFPSVMSLASIESFSDELDAYMRTMSNG
jgi:DNA-binding NtrC family response regulator